jgi:hypothetical protein
MRWGFLSSQTVCVSVGVAAVWLSLAVTNGAAQSPPPEVDLVLVLAVDVSGSITDQRWSLEKQGYAAAFRDPEVIRTIQSGPIGAIAVTLVEWSGSFDQNQVIGWTEIKDAASADQFANALAVMPRAYSSRTSISAGISFSARLLLTAPYDAPRRAIDVSGDGPDNTSSEFGGGTAYQMSGGPDADRLSKARDEAVANGIVINGLPIFGDPRAPNLDDYYRAYVIGGPGSFLIVANDFSAFAAAIRRKLILEVATISSALDFRG